jgi:hypothetical protein
MDFIPNRLVRGLRQARNAAPNPVVGNTPTATLKNGKVTHALGKLAQAGVVDSSDGQLIKLASTTASVHAEKITHVTSKLAQAGLSSDNTPAKSSSSHGLATKYIIVIAVVGAVVLLALLAGGGLCWRRYRRRKAYNVVSRGVDNNPNKGKGVMREKEDMFNADMQEAESFNVDGQKLTERNFESGYDKVETGYEGTGYGGVEEPGHGDKRSNFEA